jgi:glyoxylase-like metal-dependent hydrolase (beta-lactamase superfamily II)
MSLTGTNTYIVDSDPAYVIDPGPDDAGHLAAVRAAGDARGGIAGVLLTHSHADHSVGVPALGAPLLWGQVSEGHEFMPPADDATAAAGSGREVGPFRVVPTPGHAADHVCFVWSDVCFCGDLILGVGSSIVPPAAYGGSLADYLTSLDRIAELDVDLLCPGHGPWITDPAAKIAEYREHRLDRERKLLAALEAGERSRERLLDAAWDDVPEAMRPAAAQAMEAHLEKLEAEGRLPEGVDGP